MSDDYNLIGEAKEYAQWLKAKRVDGFTVVQDLVKHVESLSSRIRELEAELAKPKESRGPAFMVQSGELIDYSDDPNECNCDPEDSHHMPNCPFAKL